MTYKDKLTELCGYKKPTFINLNEIEDITECYIMPAFLKPGKHHFITAFD